MIILAQLLDFLVGFPDEEISLLPIEFLLFVHQSEQEKVVGLGSVVHLEFDLLWHMLMSNSNIVVLIGVRFLTFDNTELLDI